MQHNYKAQLLDVKKQFNARKNQPLAVTAKQRAGQRRYKVVPIAKSLGEQFYERLNISQDRRLIASCWRA